mgnify:FL=1
MDILELNYLDIDENNSYKEIIKRVLQKCFEIEKLENKNLYVNVVLTNAKNIKSINKEHRGIDRETDVLSFPMFEKDEIANLDNTNEDILGDMVISIERVEEQAKEYGHSFERELAYMVVHSFYHLLGYDHMTEEDKKEMREKEENVLGILGIRRV